MFFLKDFSKFQTRPSIKIGDLVTHLAQTKSSLIRVKNKVPFLTIFLK